MILVFGGTTEGRVAVEVCEQAGKPFYYSTKGDTQQLDLCHGIRLTGEMTQDEMLRFCQEKEIKCIVDAAHPFAQVLHQTIDRVGIPVVRLQRHFSEHESGIIYCRDYTEAVRKLFEMPSRCLLAMSGVQTISKMREYWKSYPTFFRVLDRQESVEIAKRSGFPLENLKFYSSDNKIPSLMQEKQMRQESGCDASLTKESGDSGGYQQKIEAAKELGLKLFVVKRPVLPSTWTYVYGKHGLRHAIEQFVPEFFPLKSGFTTGCCATAAVKAALLSVLQNVRLDKVEVMLPDDEEVALPVRVESKGVASVVKDYSDDPDVTRGCRIEAKVELNDTGKIEFVRGRGVGVVTLPGLGIPVGDPAINATPRMMMQQEVRRLTPRGCRITISVDHGEELAQRTFNTKVGVTGGISIIGTTGIVSPLSNEAFINSIAREIEVAWAIGCKEIGLVSGRNGEMALKEKYPELRAVHYGNFVGETLKKAHQIGFRKVIMGIMIGKAVKLAAGNLDTHSHKVQMDKDFLKKVAGEDADKIEGVTMARELWKCMPPSFFEKIKILCQKHCQTVFPEGKVEIHLICESQVS